MGRWSTGILLWSVLIPRDSSPSFVLRLSPTIVKVWVFASYANISVGSCPTHHLLVSNIPAFAKTWNLGNCRAWTWLRKDMINYPLPQKGWGLGFTEAKFSPILTDFSRNVTRPSTWWNSAEKWICLRVIKCTFCTDGVFILRTLGLHYNHSSN